MSSLRIPVKLREKLNFDFVKGFRNICNLVLDFNSTIL